MVGSARVVPQLVEPDPPLDDGVVRLRRWSFDDMACVEAAAHDPVLPEGTTLPVPWSPLAGRAFIERQHGRASSGQGVALAVALAGSDEAVGTVTLLCRPAPGTVALGYWLLSDHRRRGLMGRAIKLALRWVTAVPHVARIEALVEPSNLASQRVMASAGFTCEGTLRSYLAFPTRRADAQMWSLLPTEVR